MGGMDDRPTDTRRFRRFDLEDGWVVLVGKTDRDNDHLSLRFRQPQDLWFHVAGCPGSHVLLLEREGFEPPAATVKEAAAIAAWYSKARTARKVSVSVTKAGNVSKRRGAPAGEVTISRQRLLKVVPGLPSGTGDER